MYRKESIWIECVLLLWTAGSQVVGINDPEFIWKQIGVSPKVLTSIAQTDSGFKFNVYQDMANFGEKSMKNYRFYYSPLSIMDYMENKPVITSDAQNVRSVHLPITILMSDSIRVDVAKVLSLELKQQIAIDQILLFPFKRVILRNSNEPTVVEGFDVVVQKYWVPYYNEKFLSFYIPCASNEICLNIQTSLNSDPEFVAKLQLTYDLGDTFTSVKQVPVYAKNVCERPFFANLLKENEITSEVQGTEYEINQLVSELISSLSREHFDFKTETVIYESYSVMKTLLEQKGFFSKRTECNPSNPDLYKRTWNSFEWSKNNKNGFSKADDANDFVTYLYSKLEYPNKKLLIDFFSTSLTFDKPRKESIDPNFPIDMPVGGLNIPPNLSLIQAIEKARIMVAWDGRNFMPKTLIVRRIFLSKCRSMLRDIPFMHVPFKYSKAFFTMPISQPLVGGGWKAVSSKIR